MDRLLDKYADAVIYSALKIRKGDVLSINTEEKDAEFAKLLASKAKRLTGNGSYIQRLEKGRIVEEYDFLSDFPLRKSPTCFVYIPLFKGYPEISSSLEFDPHLYQSFKLLSDPIDNPSPSLPFVSCPLPSPEWDNALGDDGVSSSIIYNILGLDDDLYIENLNRRNENLIYQCNLLNEKELVEGRIANDEGTDLSFSFLPSSSFVSSFLKTTEGRLFSPSVVSVDLFRLIEPTSLNGWLNISKPIVLWGNIVSSLSVHFNGGKIDEYIGSSHSEALFSLYLKQEIAAGRASMITISEISNPLFDEEITLYPELDRGRCVSITIGGPKGEAVDEKNISTTVDSLLSLSLPLGSESTVITALTKSGEEKIIYSGGYITEDDDE